MTLCSGWSIGAAEQLEDGTLRVVAVAPDHAAATVDISVTNPGGTSSNTSADDFTYAAPSAATVTGASPGSGLSTRGTSWHTWEASCKGPRGGPHSPVCGSRKGSPARAAAAYAGLRHRDHEPRNSMQDVV